MPDDVVGQVDLILSTHPPQNLEAMAKLAFWQIGSVGYTQLVGLSLPQKGVQVSNARGVFDVPIGEWNVAMIAGAALDTHYHYPMPPDHPLWQFPNVIMTPHISGSSLNYRFNGRIWDIFIENLRRFMAGEELLNQLTAPELDGEI